MNGYMKFISQQVRISSGNTTRKNCSMRFSMSLRRTTLLSQTHTTSCLYFRPENAKAIFVAMPEIIEKYHKRVAEDAKRMKIEQLKAELELLKEGEDGKD